MNITSAPRRYMTQGFNSGIEFQLLDNTLTGIHPPVRCKELISGIIWSEHIGKAWCRWQLSYTPGKLELPRKRFKIALNNYSVGTGAPFDNHSGKLIPFTEEDLNKVKLVLHYVEDTIGIPRSEISLRNNGDYILIDSSYDWISSLYMTAFYTSLLRYSQRYKGENVEQFLLKPTDSGTDAIYFKQCRRGISALLKGQKVDQPYEKIESEGGALERNGLYWLDAKIKENESIPA